LHSHVLLAVATILSCESASPVARTVQDVERIDAGPTVSRSLSRGCVQFLAQLQCWLRASGNGPSDVSRAVGNARFAFEGWSASAEVCEHAAYLRSAAFGSAGCQDLNGDVRDLPPAAAVECPEGEFFFVRIDGHVSGCHQDCITDEDCASGATCASTGSAAGGPIDEPFCERATAQGPTADP
jgi:hypothetical protein